MTVLVTMMHRIIAHRGHKVGAPEQTATAFRLAADLGATILEADLRFTRDGIPVMMHDYTLDRTTSGQGPLEAVDWSQIEQLDAGAWFGTKFAGERILRLEELFQIADQLNVGLCIEAKGEGRSNAHAALYAAKEIRRRSRLDVDYVASFDHAALAAAVELVPGLRTAPDRLPERGETTAQELIEQARFARARVIQHHFADLKPSVVAEVQASGIEVWAWPMANELEARLAYESGAIGLMGDDVAAIAAVLGAND
jgi:glycerophosphoryl diester phosphodiesterase